MSRVVYLTRLRLRSRWLIPRFLLANIPIMKQLARTPGFIDGRSILEFRAAFWTMSLWESADAMKAFRNAGAHGAVMPKNIDWSIESSGASWERDSLATWPEAHAHMTAHGYATRVRHPSPDHAGLTFPAPRPLLHFPLKMPF